MSNNLRFCWSLNHHFLICLYSIIIVILHFISQCFYFSSSEVSLGKKSDYSAKRITEGTTEYYALNRWMDRAKTETNQDVVYFPERVHFLKDIYWAAAYHAIFDNHNNEYLFPNFVKNVLKKDDGYGNIKYDSATLFSNVYEKLKDIVAKCVEGKQ